MQRCRRALSLLALVTLFSGCGGGGSGSDVPPAPPQPPVPITYSIQISTPPVSADERVGQTAEATIEWQYTSSATNPTATSYSVTSSTEGVQISGGTGSAQPSTTISTTLTFACTDIGAVEAELVVSVGTATSNVSWSINCSGQRITIEPIEATIASAGFDALSEVAWSYETIGESAASLAYAATSNVESLLIDPFEGSASPGTSIDLSIAYRCEAEGTFEIPLTISVGTATQSATWQVECTTETIQIDASLEAIEVSVGETVEATLGWRFLTTSSIPREVSYQLQTENALLSIANAEGSAAADSLVENELSFQCDIAGAHQLTLAISVGSAHQEVMWSVTCSVEVIEILSSPLVSAMSIGETAVRELAWRISSSRTEETEFIYRVRVDDQRVQVMGGSGAALAGTEISTLLSYRCHMEGSWTFLVSISVGNSQATTTWVVDCSKESIEVTEPLIRASESIGSTIDQTLVWLVETSAVEPREFAYAIESSSELLLIEATEGRTMPGEAVEARIQVECVDVVRVNAAITITVGSDRKTVIWTVECTEEEIVVEVPPPPLSTSVGQTIASQFNWRLLTSAIQEREFSYVITTDSDKAAIETSMAATSPVLLVTTKLTFQCTDQGLFEIPFEIRVGSAVFELTWSVECSVETIEVVAAPSALSLSLGETALGSLTWRFDTTSERLESYAFGITSDLEGVAITPSVGTLSAGQDLIASLAFDCVEQRSAANTFTIVVGSAVKKVDWFVECTGESISLVDDPLPSRNVAIGEIARLEFRWTFESTATLPRSFEYSVTTGDANLGISNSTGSVASGESIEHELTFSCNRERSASTTLRIKVGDVERETQWLVHCTRDTVNFISQPLPQSIPVGESTTAALTWQFQSSFADRSVSYSVSASIRGVQIRNGEGTVRSGHTVETTLRFVCQTRREVAIELTINAGGATRTTLWRVVCFGEDLTKFSANFFQGPLIQSVAFEHGTGGWQHAIVSGVHAGGTAPLQYRTDRQIFVEIQTRHNESAPLPLTMWFDVDGNSQKASLVKGVETEDLDAGSEFRYISSFLFDVPDEAFSGYGNLRILIDPNSLYPEPNESNNRVIYVFDNQNTTVLPQLEIVYIPIRSREGVASLDDLSYYTDPIYELLPVSHISSSRGHELDLRNYSWHIDNGRLFIDELYDIYLLNARRGQLYQGVATPPAGDGRKLCGIAYVGGNVSITSAPLRQCAPHVSAHEVGHNFNLAHAPACGAEDENPDPDYPYVEGDIGTETGWLMRQQAFIDGSDPAEFVQLTYRYYDTMSYCPEVFTSQFSYGRTLAYLRTRSNVVASIPSTSAFDPVEGKSIVVRGTSLGGQNWKFTNVKIVNREPLGFQSGAATHTLQLIDLASGGVMYQEPLLLKEIAEIDVEERIWGARVPYFEVDRLQLLIVDQLGKLVFDHVLDLNQIERAD